MHFVNIAAYIVLFACVAVMCFKYAKLYERFKEKEKFATNLSVSYLNVHDKYQATASRVEGLSNSIISMKDEVNRNVKMLDIYKARAEDLESKIERDFGVEVRKEITIIKADFNKVEMVMMFSGVFKLLKEAKSLDDVTYYTALAKKIQGFIDQMTEEQEINQPEAKT